MALFPSRHPKPAAEPVSTPPAADSLELIRRRARQRLLGSVVLVGLGVVAFPMLFDAQPRPIPVDIPIDIPDRSKAVSPPASAADSKRVDASSSLGPKEEVLPDSDLGKNKPLSPAIRASEAIKSAANPVSAAAPAPRAQVTASVPKSPAASDAMPLEPRFVVQVGAFAEVQRAREVRQKLERAGLKTYTQVVETADGKRIRVRVGPFAVKSEAERAAGKVRGLDLSASILSL